MVCVVVCWAQNEGQSLDKNQPISQFMLIMVGQIVIIIANCQKYAQYPNRPANLTNQNHF